MRSLRMGTVRDMLSPKSLTRPVVRLSKQGQNSTYRHLHGGQVERLKHGLLKGTEGKDRSSNPHRVPSHWWRHHLKNIVGGANAVNSLVMRSPIPWNTVVQRDNRCEELPTQSTRDSPW